MDGWTKLHEKAAESVSLSELLDDEPEAFALFILMVAKAGVWGRFPAHPKLLKAKVAPMSERLTSKRIAELLPTLIDRGFITQYVVNDTEYVFNTNHFVYNAKQSWHRTGKPQCPPPPGFVAPKELNEYLIGVAAGKFAGKSINAECEKFGVMNTYPQQTPQDDSHGVVSDQSQTTPKADATLETLDFRRETLENESENTLVPPDGDTTADDCVDTASVKDRIHTLKEKRKREADERKLAAATRLDELLDALSENDRRILDHMIAGYEAVRGNPLTVRQHLEQAEIYTKELSEHGAECWHSCCEISMNKEKFTTQYARGCTDNWELENKNRGDRQLVPNPVDDERQQRIAALEEALAAEIRKEESEEAQRDFQTYKVITARRDELQSKLDRLKRGE